VAASHEEGSPREPSPSPDLREAVAPRVPSPLAGEGREGGRAAGSASTREHGEEPRPNSRWRRVCGATPLRPASPATSPARGEGTIPAGASSTASKGDAAAERGHLLRWPVAALCLAVLALAVPYVIAVAHRASLVAPAATPILYDRHGAFLTQVGATSGDGRIDYGYWPLAALPDRVVRATLALEDRRFWSHPGVDPAAIARALWQNLAEGRRISGASTIAMQVARMQDPRPRTLWSKAVEAGAALVLTARYGREALLAHYLRLVPYGNGSHGIAHAARWYFEKPVADLSWAEIALLSAIPQSPTAMNPLRPAGLARAVARGHRALDALARQGVIGEAELALAHGQLDAIRAPAPRRRPAELHAVLRVADMLAADRIRPANPSDPRIRTSLDIGLQTELAAVARRHLAAWRPAGAEQIAVMVVERGSREVVAALGSTDYRDRRSGAIDFLAAERSPGSTLKPFIYALALERGLLKPSDVMADLPEGASGIGNADGGFLGPMLPRQALANSRNVPATNLLRKVGLETTFRFLRELGVHDLEVPADSFGLSLAIGSMPTTLERLMRAYGALAEEGMLGNLVWYDGAPAPSPRRVLSSDTARLVTLFLADPMARLPSFPRYEASEFPFPVALKTGTSQGYRDAWLVGWSQRYMVGVWVGRGDAGTMTQLSGARSAARLAHRIFLELHDARAGDLADLGFPPPEGREPVELCVIGGKRSDGGCGETLTEWVKPEEMPPVENAAFLRRGPEGDRLGLVVPAVHRAWAKAEGYPVAEGGVAEAVRLSVSNPEHHSRIWRNPGAPPSQNRIALKVVAEPHVPQVVWYVDGEPFATADPDEAVYWPLEPGKHRFQARLPFQPGASNVVHVTVE
jgi:penicillin-binding protein 1C